MKKHLHNMLQALISEDSDTASKELHAYLTSKTRKVMLGEKDEDCDDDDKESKDKKPDRDGDGVPDYADDDDDHDDDGDGDDKDDDSKSKKVKEGLESIEGSKYPKNQGGADSQQSEWDSYNKNDNGKASWKKGKKSNSEDYGYDDVKKNSRKLEADSDSGASAGGKAPNGYKTTVHKDNSHSAKSEDKGAKGLKKISEKSTESPDSDGKKENRRTDKTKRFHGKSREGVETEYKQPAK